MSSAKAGLRSPYLHVLGTPEVLSYYGVSEQLENE